MCNFFSFQNYKNDCYTTINVDKIAVVTKRVGCLPKSSQVVTQAQVLVEIGNDIKEFILDEDQYKRLNCILQQKSN